ncbi:OsmC family protein [Alteromonas sp. ASW11-36]|uniref:OsmC family protein n=1 Tax=Alteromonas arenosi TaxID=3055817 RepID=A0ABT7SY44_9ALTE|nr:OsmC family protein [Alteromonas sp. ASW11-36]MDM7860929.1 OsmC family protein [Alteromonas sp. ASW11-36]
MQAKVEWRGGLSFHGKTDSGYEATMDGDGKAISPMESVLVAVGACSSVDVVEILRKARQDLQACHCELSAERAAEPPRVFTKIHAHYVVKGSDIKEKHLARAVQLSAEKYCSVMLMLHETVDVTTSYAIESA